MMQVSEKEWELTQALVKAARELSKSAPMTYTVSACQQFLRTLDGPLASLDRFISSQKEEAQSKVEAEKMKEGEGDTAICAGCRKPIIRASGGWTHVDKRGYRHICGPAEGTHQPKVNNPAEAVENDTMSV